MSTVVIQSALARRLGCRHPILLAGMAVVSSAPLAAAVSNAGGLGVVGAGFPNPSPDRLRALINDLQSRLDNPAHFGVDLLIPQVGGSARKTNKDYTKGQLPEMIDIICASGCKLFVCAVGVPPRWMVDKLHAAGVLVMNMVGSPRHVSKSLAVGVDALCAQGYEAGGHTGEIATMVLVPKVVELCRGKISPLTGGPVHVVAAGGIYNGATMAAALSLGAEAVWCGTRFVASEEATANKLHKQTLLKARTEDTLRSVVFTGRPARFFKTDYIKDWVENRGEEVAELTRRGKIPVAEDMRRAQERGEPWSFVERGGISFGQSCGAIDTILPAAEIVRELVEDCARVLRQGGGRVVATRAML